MSRVVVGVWCGTAPKNLLQLLHETPLLKLTLSRCHTNSAGSARALVPWSEALDGLAEEIKTWGYGVERCYPEERIAMRDLVTSWTADIGILVQGHAADVDAAELRLAHMRIAQGGYEEYVSSRVRAYPAQRWLMVQDTEEWPKDLRSLEELRRFYPPRALGHDTRRLRERQG